MALAAGVLLSPTVSRAQDPACDSTFMSSMRAKAWMEAQREMMIAQSVIAKPDSVFALGCFGSFANNSKIGNFSNGQIYDTSGKVSSFVSSAFAHKYGGNHYSTSASNSGTNSNCGIMMSVWNAARCYNFEIGKVLSLDNASSYDRGAYVNTCAAPSDWSGQADLLKKQANKSVSAAFDDLNVKLFLDVTAPLSVKPTSGKCSAPIPTGVKIQAGGTTIPEIVCSNPGCTSNGAASPACCKATVPTDGGTPTFSNCSS